MQSPENPYTKADRALAFVTLAGLLAFALVVMYAAHGNMVYNAVRLPLEDRLDVKILLPQGWKFFTRDAQEQQLVAYQADGQGAWRNAMLGANGDRRNWFGLSRRPRAQGIELGLLLEKASKNWLKNPEFHCSGSIPECLNRATANVRTHNISPRPTLCGTIGIVAQHPVPWAWAHDRDRLVMPAQIIKLEVQC